LGVITGPEGSKPWKLKPSGDVVFLSPPLANNGPHWLNAGDKVSFSMEQVMHTKAGNVKLIQSGRTRVAQAKLNTPTKRLNVQHGHESAVRMARVLGLSLNQTCALELTAEWEGLTPSEFCRRSVIDVMNISHDDLKTSVLHGAGGSRARAWAKRFYTGLKPLLEKGEESSMSRWISPVEKRSAEREGRGGAR
jgi:hypothetical protein